MPKRIDSMRQPTALLHALDGLNITPPKPLRNIVDAFELLGPPMQSATTDPMATLIDSAAAGKLTPKTLDELLATAAADAATNTYRQDFRLRAERKFATRYHQILLDGAADDILGALRPRFDDTAAELTAARDQVDLQATPQRLLTVTATPDEQAAWARLPELVRQIDRLAAVAATFGANGDLAVIDDLTDRDSLLRLGWVDDRALMCCSGDIATVTETFRQPNPAWQTSPWLRVPLELQTIASAQERYREVAESDFNARESHRSGSGRLTETGFVPDTRINPHTLPVAEAAEATA